MRTYSKSKIMSHAWRRFRLVNRDHGRESFSESLRETWRVSKMITKTNTSVEVRDLKPGMRLFFTGEEVISSPTAGISTGKGKMDLVVKTKAGSMIQKSWNRHTLISVEAW